MNKNTILPKIDFAVGGQAVIEGVMMRSPNFVTVAVRKTGGEIKVKDENFRGLAMRMRFFGIPLLRGVINLFEMMIIGMRMLNFSATEAMDDGIQKPASSGKVAKTKKDASLAQNKSNLLHDEKALKSSKKTTMTQKIGMFISFAASLFFAFGMSLFLFKFLPLYITDFLSRNFSVLNQNYLYYNLVDGFIKTTFFVLYIGLLGLLPSLHRVFEYHGAEHKSIYTYEKGLPLEVEHAKKMTRFHPRCGTSFILVVFLLSIFIYTFVPRQPDFLLNFFLRVAFLPLVAGISYEVLKWSAKHSSHPLVKVVTLPGLLFQRLTTQEPSDDQLEVALFALRKALEMEESRLQKIPGIDAP